MAMSRREFLKRAGLGVYGLSLLSPSASAANSAAWGSYPPAALKHMVPPAKQAKKVLEVFLGGGFSPWETLYTVDDKAFGYKDKAFYWTFHEGKNNVAQMHKACAGANAGPLTQPWVTDKLGKQVKLGPHVLPLRARQDIIDRMRVLVTQHESTAHGVALPLSITGHNNGSPRQAGIGSVVAHHQQAHAKGLLTEPGAYVVTPMIGGNIIEPAAAVGLHPGSSRPLYVRMTFGNDFPYALSRPNLGDMATSSDKLLTSYIKRYNQRLIPPGASQPVRAPGVADHAHAMQLLSQAPNLSKVFDAKFFGQKSGLACGYSSFYSPTRASLELGVHLLQRPGSAARHVTVVDIGFGPAIQGYDTHQYHNAHAAIMLQHMWSVLTGLINKPGEKNPAKIDLNETMIVLNTEFGRSPKSQSKEGTHNGRNHWPWAYTTALIGGPIGKQQAGLLGAIDAKGQAVGGITPLQQRAAVLAAMGIFPFENETFPVGSVPGGDDAGASKWLRQFVLGLS